MENCLRLQFLHVYSVKFSIYTVGLPIEPTLSVGCLINDECPLYAACRNRQCINPCAEDNPCAPTAICKVINHEPECTCPDGYIGSPLTDCRPRKFQCNLKLKYKLYQRVFPKILSSNIHLSFFIGISLLFYIPYFQISVKVMVKLC